MPFSATVTSFNLPYVAPIAVTGLRLYFNLAEEYSVPRYAPYSPPDLFSNLVPANVLLSFNLP